MDELYRDIIRRVKRDLAIATGSNLVQTVIILILILALVKTR